MNRSVSVQLHLTPVTPGYSRSFDSRNFWSGNLCYILTEGATSSAGLIAACTRAIVIATSGLLSHWQADAKIRFLFHLLQGEPPWQKQIQTL
jgi:hypothetical protein